MPEKRSTYKFSDRIRGLLEKMAEEDKVSMTKILEFLIIKEAVKRGLED